jgi:hypothetical protein
MMPKIKILSKTRTQQVNVINKARQWGAAARDGDYGPVEGKTAVVINTKLGSSQAAILLSRVDFNPKKPYDVVMDYKEFMNLDTCPWSSSAKTTDSSTDSTPCPDAVVAVVGIPVDVEVGVCSQDTLKVSECDVLVQEPIAFRTLGLPFLQDAGVDVTMDGETPYILDVVNNTAKELTAKMAAKKAKKAILDGDNDSPWAIFARNFDLVASATLTKTTEEV